MSGGTVSRSPAPSSVTGMASPDAVTAEAVSSRSVLTVSRSGPGDWTIAHAWLPVAVHRTHGSSEPRAISSGSGRVSWIAGAQCSIQSPSRVRTATCAYGMAPLAVGPTFSRRFPPRDTTSVRCMHNLAGLSRCRSSSMRL